MYSAVFITKFHWKLSGFLRGSNGAPLGHRRVGNTLAKRSAFIHFLYRTYGFALRLSHYVQVKSIVANVQPYNTSVTTAFIRISQGVVGTLKTSGACLFNAPTRLNPVTNTPIPDRPAMLLFFRLDCKIS